MTSNIKKDEVLETLPTSRSYEDMGKLAPGVRVSGILDVGGNHTGAGRGSLVNYGSSNGGATLMLSTASIPTAPRATSTWARSTR